MQHDGRTCTLCYTCLLFAKKLWNRGQPVGIHIIINLIVIQNLYFRIKEEINSTKWNTNEYKMQVNNIKALNLILFSNLGFILFLFLSLGCGNLPE